MQRTYKSKKDAGGGLDPREVLLSLDDRGSTFDAFYIRNIKQTKRELSCMSSTNQNKVAANRVRKRKYVRKIVREVEPALQESLLKSTYLTPDKSIHVNKGLDLFDQLLKVSPEPLQPHKSDNDNVFNQLRLSKKKHTYGHKKMTKPRMKKFNYSSSDSSDHEKENMTDLGKHELLVEKVTKMSHNIQDDSINQIFGNISAINNIIKRKSQRQSFKRSSHKNKTRLTENLLMNAENSPLCSTPFVEKYRGKSIYRFSPIAMGNLDDSGKTTVEANSIVHVEEEMCEVPNNVKPDLFEDSDDRPSSPVLTSKSNLFSNSSGSLKIKHRAVNTCLKQKPNWSEIRNNIEEIKDDIKMDEEKRNNSAICQTSVETLPFMGFSKTTLSESEKPKELGENEQEMSILLPSRKSVILKCNFSCFGKRTPNNSKDLTQKAQVSDDMFAEDQSSSDKNGTIEASAELEPFLGFTESAINNSTEVIKIDESDVSVDSAAVEITMVDVLPETDANKTNVRVNLSSSNENSANETNCKDNSVNDTSFKSSIGNETNCQGYSENTVNSDEDFNSLKSENIEGSYSETQSLYNTCNSIEIENEPLFSEVKDLKHKHPIVVLDRINDSTFKKYYYKISDSISSEDCSGMKDCNDSLQHKDSNDNLQHQYSICEEQNDSKEEVNELQMINEDLNAESTDSQSNDEEEEKQFSFVTTRRRHEVTNETLMVILDTSNNSITSSEGNKTVLSNQDAGNKSKDNDLDMDESTINLPTNRNSVTVRSESYRHNVRESGKVDSKLDITEVKAPIVLQPGKKWERSLSIYRRMTMQSDLEQTLLEDGDLINKGRKYRQSVIHTMELQENNGPLHNESFSSYRSSVVPKPHRTTIRLAKEPNVSRISLCTTAVFDDLTEFLHEDCDDTVIELSKLSIGDSHEITVVDNQDSSVRGSTAKDYVLRRCNQTAPILFDECYPDTALKNCHKIGEGVYGEVFLWRARDGRARVLKVVPIAGSVRVNGERQKDYHEIVSEIVIAMELSALRAPIADIESHFDEGKDADTLDLHTIENVTDGFNEVIAVRCVQGSYPSRLLDLWELFDECKGSENDNPAALPADQQFIVLELANAGLDLEGYQFNNAEQAHALFLQVAFTLAVGEEAFQFEHRDLHWGNVLIAPTEQKYATYVLRGRAHRVPRCGVAATIIDYSLSRLSLPLCAGERAALYNDLATDDGLFDAVGDYQFEVYRLMRDKLGNDWKNFEPYTNILWLHYTVDKMITALRYKRTNTKLHKHFIAKLKGIKNRILDYRSAVQFVLTDNEF